MAETQVVAKQALKKLEDQLSCAICLDTFKDPKLLQCFHVYCKDCLQPLVATDRQGQLSLLCPTCRQTTLLPPATGVSDLQPAFYIHHLMEIKGALERIKEPKRVSCGKCVKSLQPATSYCRDCGEFICAVCTSIHSQWSDFVNHDVVPIEQLEQKMKQLDCLKKVILYCSLHQGKELELYCETCGELICHNCTVKKHKDHQYDLVGDTFERHKAEITASLEPIEEQLGVISGALKQFDSQSQELDNIQVAFEGNIQQQIQQLQELLEMRKAELITQLQQFIQTKKKSLAAQKDEVETIHTQLVNCLTFVRESLRTGSQGEVMKMKRAIMKQIKEMTADFKGHMLPPSEPANIEFKASSEVFKACQQFGRIFLSQKISQEKCYAAGTGLKVAQLGESASVVLNVIDQRGKACTKPVENLSCEFVPEKIDCSVKKIEANQYKICYHATNRGRHQLHIKIEGEHIKGSPFPVTVKVPVQMLGTPIKMISGVRDPWGVVVNQKGEVIVIESNRCAVSIFSAAGDKIRSFGSQGIGQGQFDMPRGVAIDDDGNVLVADINNHRIQKLTAYGHYVASVGERGSHTLQFIYPMAIAVHPQSKRVYIVDNNNHRIQILNPNLTFSSSFGNKGSGDGQLLYPWDMAFDSAGNVYVADYSNHCIQVFTGEGEFLRKFGTTGSGSGELNSPSGICIDSDNVVYVTELWNHRVSVFTHEGRFLASFGTEGSGPGQFSGPCGIAVDKNGVLYVSDRDNNCLQLL